MDFRQLRYFTLVADLQSIAKASAHLGVASPAISRSIASLEDELECLLFDRDGRGMRLTGSGEILRERALQILRDVELARQDVMAEGRHLAGDLTLGATPSVVALLGARLVERNLIELPRVRTRVSEGYSGYLQNWVQTGVVDFALVNGFQPGSAALQCERLGVERLYAIGVADFQAEPITLSDVLDAPLLLPSVQNPIRSLIDDAAETLGRTIETVVDIDSALLLKEMAANGAGLAVLPFAAVQTEVAAGQLSARPIVAPEITSDLNLIYLRERPPSKVAEALIQMIVEILEEIIASETRHGFVDVCAPAKYRGGSKPTGLRKT